MHHHHSARQATNSIRLAFFINVFFTVFEIAGGLYTNSMAILSDAWHDLGDSLALGISWFLERKSARLGDRRFSFGYRRFSLLGAVSSSLILLAGSVVIVSHSIERIMTPEAAHVPGMMLVAMVGLLANGLAWYQMRHGSSLNEQTVYWHLLEDSLGWLVVLCGSVVMHFTGFMLLDPLLSLAITLYISWQVLKKLKKSLVIFLQAVPEDIDTDLIEEEILQVDGVRSVHHAHVWTLDGQNHVISIHVVVNRVETADELFFIKKKVKNILRRLPLQCATIELEFPGESCFMGH